MGGFQIGRTFVLDFGGEGDTDAFGAVVKMRSGSIATMSEFADATDAATERKIFTEHVIEWNLEDGGVPLPIEPESIRKLDPPFRDLLYIEWMKATRGISAPFDRRSDGGGQPPEVEVPEPFIPMEAL